jgi:rsbT co-antagonist protein RsbR
MPTKAKSVLPQILKRDEQSLLREWVSELSAAGPRSPGANGGIDRQCAEFLSLLQAAAATADLNNVLAAEWEGVREFLNDFSRDRAQQGFTPTQTATFILSLKKPLFSRLRQELSEKPEALADEIWTATEMLDGLGLRTIDAYQRTREDIIGRQQQEMLELSTPVVKLWDGVLALPMIGTLDSARTQVVMETLLQRIVDTGAAIAIIDITGVPTVDTLVAQHLIKTVTAARLMGADCIISGIRPQIAQTLVHLGVQLDVLTKSSLGDAFALAMQRTGYEITRRQA